MKLLELIRMHPAVSEVLDEREDNNGWWIYLKDGWESPEMECGSIHEMTLTECVKRLKNVRQIWTVTTA